MNDIKKRLNSNRDQEVQSSISQLTTQLNSEGYTVEFGNIGIRTTYALIYTKDHEEEIVGYTFVKDMRYYKENVGKLKALQQAIARKDINNSAG